MSATSKLWEISDELAEVGELIADAGGELTPELEARLEAIEGAFDDKVERTALFIRHAQLQAENAKAEKDRLGAIQKHHERTAEGLKTYLLRCMSGAGVPKVETHRARVWVQQSGTPSIEYRGELDALPESFVRTVPETRSLDKKAVTQAIRDGEDLPAGFEVTYSSFVRIA